MTMRTLTAVVPATPSLPPELGLLLAPMRIAKPADPDAYVGRAEGVVLDERGRVLAFIVRLSPELVAGSPRTLVSAAAVTVTADAVLHVAWTKDQIRAQPRLDEDLQPHNVANGGLPLQSRWMPARANGVPPAEGMNRREALEEGIEGGAIGAVAGACVGLAIGGPIGAAALAGLFAGGGAIAGIVSGITQESAAEASELRFDLPAHREGEDATAMRLLEERLRDPHVTMMSGLLHATRFCPMTTTDAPPERAQAPASMHGAA
jgi:hypothetical protein